MQAKQGKRVFIEGSLVILNDRENTELNTVLRSIW